MVASSSTVSAARFLVLTTLAIAGMLSGSEAASARGKPVDCKPDGLPIEIGSQGAIEMTEAVEYSGESRILAADKAIKPSKLQLISPSGEALALPNPPWTIEPTRWLARGHAVYAVGTGRNQTPGKTDVVLVRWGMDSRPRLTKIATLDQIAAPARAALVEEHMAVVWAEPGADGKLRARASFIDLEAVKVGAPVDLGAFSKGGFADIASAGKGFVALWSSDQGLMRASFDAHGKATGAASPLAWKDRSDVRSAITCGERLWLVHEGAKDQLAVSTSDASGALHRVASLPASDGDHAPVLCADDNVIVAHRVIHEKAGNIVLWLSTIEPSGKTRERRIKDIAGSADTIRMPVLAAAGRTRNAFWVEGGGQDAKLWSRAIVCE